MSETEVAAVSETEVAAVSETEVAEVSETPETLTAAFPSPSPSLLSLQEGSGAAAALKVTHS